MTFPLYFVYMQEIASGEIGRNKDGKYFNQEIFDMANDLGHFYFAKLLNHLGDWRIAEEKDRRKTKSNGGHLYISKNGKKDKSISQIILCGGNATTPGLQEYFSVGLKISVDISNVWINVFSSDSQYLPPIDFKHSLGFASAIGLALSNEI